MTIPKCTKTAVSSNDSNHLSSTPAAWFASGTADHGRPYRTRGSYISLLTTILRRVIRAAKSAYYECAFNRHRFNIKNTWGVINEIISKSAKTKSFPDIFKDGQHELSCDREIANRFNAFFTNIGPDQSRNIRYNGNKTHQMGRREKCWKCDRKRSDVCLRMCDDRLCEDCNDTNRAASGGRARDDDDAEINSATPGTSTTTDVNVRNDAERLHIVVNELLSFVAYKLNLMAPDTIVQLCSSFYEETEIDSAKALLYDLCADRDDRQDRMIKRSSGPRKKALSVKDIVSLFTRKHDSITVSFVAADLGKLPPIGFNNLDVCTLLAQIQATVAELDTVKANVAAQADCDMHSTAGGSHEAGWAVRDSE